MIKLIQLFGRGTSEDEAREKVLLKLNKWFEEQVVGTQIIGAQWGYSFGTNCDNLATIEIMYKSV